jgi:hypothetical protein
MQLYVYKNNQPLGPFEEGVVLDQLRSGQLSPDDLGIRSGETNWTRLGDIFAGRLQFNEPPTATFAPPVQAAGQAFGAPAVAPKSGGGCRKAAGWTILSAGLLLFLIGTMVAIATPLMYTTPLCPIADQDKAEVEKLLKEYQSVKGTSEEYAVKFKLDQAMSSYESSNKYCVEELGTKRLFQFGSIFAALVGFFMIVIGFFIQRVRRV